MMNPRPGPRTMRTCACAAQFSIWSMSGCRRRCRRCEPCNPDRGEPHGRHPTDAGGGAGEAYGPHGDFFLQKSGADEGSSGSTH